MYPAFRPIFSLLFLPCDNRLDSIYSVRAGDETWLSLSRNGGIIDGHGGRHTIVLTCSTRKIDTYSTYLVVENNNNLSDIKTIMITMDVVVKQNTVFSVLVDGKQVPNPVIDMGEVYFYQTYLTFCTIT